MHKNPTPYTELNALLAQFVVEHQSVLGDNLVGVCLQGSFAIGDFDEHSDVDFIVVTKNPLTKTDVKALQAMHHTIFHSENSWSEYLEGSYFTQSMLGDLKTVGQALWYLDNGHEQMIQSDHCNTLVVRWVLRENAIPLIGEHPNTFMEPIDVNDLRREIYLVIVEWGQVILDNPNRFKNVFYQIFIAVNFARMLNDMIRGYPSSKLAGVTYAQEQLDAKWCQLLERSMKRRGNPSVTVRTSPDEADWQLTLDFVRHVMELATAYAQEHDLI